MSAGNFTATAASTKIVDANAHRDVICIQKTNATTIALGIGEAAVAGEGIQMTNTGDFVRIVGYQATLAIYAIGNGGTGTYQEGDVSYVPGPTPAA